jgi:hypothetical protein
MGCGRSKTSTVKPKPVGQDQSLHSPDKATVKNKSPIYAANQSASLNLSKGGTTAANVSGQKDKNEIGA